MDNLLFCYIDWLFNKKKKFWGELQRWDYIDNKKAAYVKSQQ